MMFALALMRTIDRGHEGSENFWPSSTCLYAYMCYMNMTMNLCHRSAGTLLRVMLPALTCGWCSCMLAEAC